MKRNRLTRALRLVIVAVATFLVPALSLGAWNVPKETISYDVMYKWGLVNKKAGTVRIVTTPQSNGEFHAHLSGATAKWADRFYTVRDTLKGRIKSETFLPLYYEKISHEGGDYEHNVLTYTRSGNTTTAKVTVAKKRKKDKEVKHETKTHSATGMTIDMLSSYYYMRKLDYANMKKGETVAVNVFSGKQKERLTIHYEGIETIEVKNKKYPCYHITFTFTSKNGKKTSDNMDAWISTTPGKIPLLLEGKLPIGKIRCFYTGTVS
ncbi:MAG: DUF3108 domain-containing protein [Muribaculaceae bacterium]|nr:DUF3108 domain-containing protein [Muribaculaceae bacterium]